MKQFDFNESDIFGKFDLFCKRVTKLIDMFTTIQQFSSLANHDIEGMDNLMKGEILKHQLYGGFACQFADR